MIYRVCGRAGSGKTEYMLSVLGDVIANGGEAFVIVPEQQTLDYERTVFTRLGDYANLKCEVLNFERLPNRTYRTFGGLNTAHTDGIGRNLLVAVAIDTVKDKLAAYRGVNNDLDFVKSMVSQISMLKQNGINGDMLSDVIAKLPKSLGEKIHDIAIIAEEYEKLISERGGDDTDVLTAYSDNLKNMPFFKGKTVIIDSFYSFTWQEHKIIDAIAQQAESVYISFLYDCDDETGVFDETKTSYLRVSKSGTVKDILLPEVMRLDNMPLKHAEANIWASGLKTVENCDSVFEFIECKSAFDECEAAACAVTSYLAKGLRMRDIAVIARNLNSYDGIIDAVLQKHSINAFVSSKDELSEKPTSVFLLSGVEACVDGFSLNSVRKYIKSGLTGLSQKNAKLLLRYANTWNINGKAWINEAQWTNNPDGYVEEATQKQLRELKNVNEAKTLVGEQLSALYETFSGDPKSCEEYVKAIYTHLVSCGIDKSIIKQTTRYRVKGDEDQAQKTLQLWDKLIGVLDRIYLTCGSLAVTPERFLFLLKLAVSEQKVGTIPLYADAVQVGDASMIRADNVKAVILLGVNDGVFPAAPVYSSLLHNDELMALEEKGIILGDTVKSQIAKEKLYFYTSLTCASEYVTVIYNNNRPSRPSVTAIRLMKMLDGAKKRVFGEAFADNAFSPAACAQNILSMPEDIKKTLSDMGLNMEDKVSTMPLAEPEAIINLDIKNLHLSPSKLDKYTNCAFSYFGRYVLNLTLNQKASFKNAQIGTFVHKILEIFISSCISDGAFVNPSDDRIKSAIDSITEEYILAVCGSNIDRRFKYIFTRLKKTLFLLIRNICDELASSDFIPVEFERHLDGDETVLVTENGNKVSVSGVVDRIDEFKKGRTTYVRIVDYKTGSTTFSKDALKEGLGLQMFLYLFAICGKQNKKPAGVLYVPATFSPTKINEQKDMENIDVFVKKKFKRSGLLLEDMDIVSAMEKDMGGVYVPAKLKKDGTFDSYSSVATVEQLGKLKLSVEKYIITLADRLISGNMSVSPLKLDSKHDACRYCDMKTVCRLSSSGVIARNHNDVKIEIGD